MIPNHLWLIYVLCIYRLPTSPHLQYYLSTIFLLFVNTVLLITYQPYTSTYQDWILYPEKHNTNYKEYLMIISSILTGIHAFL